MYLSVLRRGLDVQLCVVYFLACGALGWCILRNCLDVNLIICL